MTRPVKHVRASHSAVAAQAKAAPGEWVRVRAYQAAGYDAPQRHTHWHDLECLHRMGVLDRRETAGRRWYVPSRTITNETSGGTR